MPDLPTADRQRLWRSSTISPGQVQIAGPSSSYTRIGNSGQIITYHFCPSCGTTLHWELRDLPDMIAGSRRSGSPFALLLVRFLWGFLFDALRLLLMSSPTRLFRSAIFGQFLLELLRRRDSDCVLFDQVIH
jgi:hypothetical protein